MAHRFAQLAFTPTVRALQEAAGSRESYAPMDHGEDYAFMLGEREAGFITARDSFYMASVSETGWPYLQHRGGPAGFMKVLSPLTLGFADYAGNRQYVSAGNLKKDNRVSLFFMDYPNQRRLKLMGRIETVSLEDEVLMQQLQDDNYLAAIERGYIIHVEAFDWNCPQHITPRFTEAEAVSRLTTMPGRPAPDIESPKTSLGSGPLSLTVSAMRQLTPTVRSYELRASNGKQLPQFTAGAHLRIPVQMDSGEITEREYSISSNPDQRYHYEIAVQREEVGRGGSAAVHQNLQLGTELKVDLPINLFELHRDRRPALLIAGGIGITPIRAMAHVLRDRSVDFHLHYAGRELCSMPYLDELNAEFSQQLQLHASSEGSRLDVKEALTSLEAGTQIYVCGPARMIADVVSRARDLGIPDSDVHFERFD